MKKKIGISNPEALLKRIQKQYNNQIDIEEKVCMEWYDTLCQPNVVFRVADEQALMEYVAKYLSMHQLQRQLQGILQQYTTLIIERVEYERTEEERTPTIGKEEEQEVAGLSQLVTALSDKLATPATLEEGEIYHQVDRKLRQDHLFAKDIELLKKILQANTTEIKETYDEKTRTKYMVIGLPKVLTNIPIKAKLGSIEYNQHMTSYIVRMERLLKHLKDYIQRVEIEGEEQGNVARINQSTILQDAVNIAVATFQQQVYQAISGHDEIAGFLPALSKEKEVFKSRKVNRHGKLGIGYDRRTDSEKKIVEKIQEDISEKRVADKGILTLYTKWEPCPSCYLVIHQFQQRHPNIIVKVKYQANYGLPRKDV